MLRALLQRSAALRIISVKSELLERSIPLQAASAVRRSSLALEQDCMENSASSWLGKNDQTPRQDGARRCLGPAAQDNKMEIEAAKEVAQIRTLLPHRLNNT